MQDGIPLCLIDERDPCATSRLAQRNEIRGPSSLVVFVRYNDEVSAVAGEGAGEVIETVLWLGLCTARYCHFGPR